MTRDRSNFLSLTTFKGRSVAFENDKSRTIVDVDKIGKSLSHSTDNMYLVNGFQHN